MHHNHAPAFIPLALEPPRSPPQPQPDPQIAAENLRRERGQGSSHFSPTFSPAPFLLFNDFLYAISPALLDYSDQFSKVGFSPTFSPGDILDLGRQDVLDIFQGFLPPLLLEEFWEGLEAVQQKNEGTPLNTGTRTADCNTDWRGNQALSVRKWVDWEILNGETMCATSDSSTNARES